MLALGALRGVCDRLYGWDVEPNIHEMERARNYGDQPGADPHDARTNGQDARAG
jgi:hypothetical protein